MTRASAGPLGLLNDVCWDLMCTACPVVDLDTRHVRCKPSECLVTDQAIILPSDAPSPTLSFAPFNQPADEKKDDEDEDEDEDNGRVCFGRCVAVGA